MASKQYKSSASVTLSNGGGSKPSESVGVSSGLSAKTGFDAEMAGPAVDYSGSQDGFGVDRLVKDTPEKASKNGKSFDIC